MAWWDRKETKSFEVSEPKQHDYLRFGALAVVGYFILKQLKII